MKFTKHTFLMLGLASVLSLGQQKASYATFCDRNHPVSAGNVCLNSTVHQCKPGCYCTGGSVKSQTVTTSDFKKGCAKGWFKWKDHDGGWTLCPDDFKLSDEGAKSYFDCYTEVDGEKIYRSQYVDCQAGFYAPKKTKPGKACSPCPDDDTHSNYYCPGLKNQAVYSETKDQGLRMCDPGTRPKANKAGCEPIPDPILCPKGTYLPKHSSVCDECPDGWVCLGGKYEEQYPLDQGKLYPDQACGPDEEHEDRTNMIANREKDGCTECGKGYKPNSTYTECVDAEIEVEPGKYLPANRVQEVDCIGTNKFCPGGKFWKKDFEQGRYDCPTDFEPKKSAGAPGNTYCEGTMSKNVMKEGFSGNGKCWQKTDPADYRYCIYGVRFELPESDE